MEYHLGDQTITDILFQWREESEIRHKALTDIYDSKNGTASTYAKSAIWH